MVDNNEVENLQNLFKSQSPEVPKIANLIYAHTLVIKSTHKILKFAMPGPSQYLPWDMKCGFGYHLENFLNMIKFNTRVKQ